MCGRPTPRAVSILLCVVAMVMTVQALPWLPSVEPQNEGPVTTSTKLRPLPASTRNHLELLSWVVEVCYDPRRHSQRHLDTIADDLATDVGLVNRGQIGTLRGLYQLDHKLHHDHFSTNVLVTPVLETGEMNINLTLPDHWTVKEMNNEEWLQTIGKVTTQLENHQNVEWFTQLHAFRRKPRSFKAKQFIDPAFKEQWHLVNRRIQHQDLNITGVWERNITGRGVVTAVVDDGLEWTNPDIQPNYLAEASYDLNNNDRDPMPTSSDSKNHHGTRCAGEIAAAANDVCAVGVAYKSKIAGLKVLDGPMTDSLEGVAFTTAKDLVDVYSCSWGPDDDGKTVDGPHYIAVRALREAVDYGRRGYGSIFVVASGNGGMVGDNCNFDGYANSIYTVTIGAVDELGNMPYYAEECASMLAVTYSSGSGNLRSIVTTDWTKAGGTGCTTGHTGTSAAAPLAAGMIALMLQARPCLTWRDVQHIIVMAAVKVDIDVAHWTRNLAGFHHSHKHGFGLMNAWRLVNAAKTWRPVPWMTLYSTDELVELETIPDKTKELILKYEVTPEDLDGYDLFTLEYVHVIVTLAHKQRGDLEIRLACPSGTSSVLAAPREADQSEDGFDAWTFSTVRCWGETPDGDWVLTIHDTGGNGKSSRGIFKKWQLKLYGSAMSPKDVAERRKGVEDASSGSMLYDNVSLPCPPPPLRNKPVSVISQKNLKILVLVSAFCLVMAIYESFEYIYCYDDEKKKQREYMAKLVEERQSANSTSQQNRDAGASISAANANEQVSNEEDCEDTNLLTVIGADHEAIPMSTLSANGTHSSHMSSGTAAGLEIGAAGTSGSTNRLQSRDIDGEIKQKGSSSSGRKTNHNVTQKAGITEKVMHTLGGYFKRGSNGHRYKAIPDSDKLPLLMTDDPNEDYVVFDLTHDDATERSRLLTSGEITNCDLTVPECDSTVPDIIRDGPQKYSVLPSHTDKSSATFNMAANIETSDEISNNSVGNTNSSDTSMQGKHGENGDIQTSSI